MPRRSAHLPDALVRLAPDLRELLQHGALDGPGLVILRQPAAPRLVEGAHHLAVDVELALPVRGVADPHRRRAREPGQPIRLPLVEAALAREPVHDLQLVGRARHGAHEPVAPRLRFLEVAAVHQGEQRHRRIAQPAIAVVPIAGAADPFRQGGGGGRHDAAGRSVGETLQRDQRTAHRLLPMRRHRAVLGHRMAARAPLRPERLRVGERQRRVDRVGNGEMRGRIGQHERDGLAGRDRELRTPSSCPRRAGPRSCASPPCPGPRWRAGCRRRAGSPRG